MLSNNACICLLIPLLARIWPYLTSYLKPYGWGGSREQYASCFDITSNTNKGIKSECTSQIRRSRDICYQYTSCVGKNIGALLALEHPVFLPPLDVYFTKYPSPSYSPSTFVLIYVLQEKIFLKLCF